MTAPNVGGGTQGLLQTIMMIKELQSRDAAQQLAREQFGLAQVQSKDQALQSIRDLAASTPGGGETFLPHLDSLAAQTGIDRDLIQTTLMNTTPSEAATKANVVARGATAAGSAIEQPAAYAGLTGSQPGALQLDALQHLLFSRSQQYLSSLPQDQQSQFGAGVLQKVATGQTPGEALTENLFSALPKDQQTRAIEIGKGLAPNADALLQGKLGAGDLALKTHVAEAEAAAREIQLRIAMADAQSRLKGKQLDDASTLLKAIQTQQQFLSNQSSNLTDEGQAQQNATLNALYKQLGNIDPDLAKIFTPVPLQSYLTAPGALSGLKQGYVNARKQP